MSCLPSNFCRGAGNFPAILRQLGAQNLADLSSYYLHISTFSLILKVFNIRKVSAQREVAPGVPRDPETRRITQLRCLTSDARTAGEQQGKTTTTTTTFFALSAVYCTTCLSV